MNRKRGEEGYVLLEALTVVAVVGALGLFLGVPAAGELSALKERVSEVAWRRQYTAFAREAQRAGERVELPFYLVRHEQVLERGVDRLGVGYADGVAERRLEVVVRENETQGGGSEAVEFRVGGVVVARLGGLESAKVVPWIGREKVLWGFELVVSRPGEPAHRLFLRFGTPGGSI